ELLPALPPEEARRIEGEQEIIARYDPARAVKTLPVLLAKRKDRARLLTLLDCVLADERVQRIEPSTEQKAMLPRIRGVLGAGDRRPVAARRGNGSRTVATMEGRAKTNHTRGRAVSSHSKKKAVTQ